MVCTLIIRPQTSASFDRVVHALHALTRAILTSSVQWRFAERPVPSPLCSSCASTHCVILRNDDDRHGALPPASASPLRRCARTSATPPRMQRRARRRPHALMDGSIDASPIPGSNRRTCRCRSAGAMFNAPIALKCVMRRRFRRMQPNPMRDDIADGAPVVHPR